MATDRPMRSTINESFDWVGVMIPINFSCKATLPLAPEEIAHQILELTNWPDFHGYGPLPGIKSATFDAEAPGIVGTRIRVISLDGSSHVEEIVEWQPDLRVRLEMKEFSSPLSRLARRFVETWDFERVGNETKVTRSFEMNAKSLVAWPALWVISLMLKGAIARHLREMKTALSRASAQSNLARD